jgi:hypothetical protein
VLVGLGAAGLVGVLAGALLVTHVVSPNGHKPSSADTASSAALSSLRESESAAVIGVLRRYQADYSASDLQGLGGLFVPDVVRHGFEAHGCGTAKGKRAVLAQYMSQFTKDGHQRYILLGLNQSAIALGRRGTAQVNTTYEIPGVSHDTGAIGFTLSTSVRHWLIAKIYATCHPSYPVTIPQAEAIPPSEAAATGKETPIVQIPAAEP